tara:strand:+ start:78 stop:428 length:351 start_codon:yes stop_codon:yes gene_type:complete
MQMTIQERAKQVQQRIRLAEANASAGATSVHKVCTKHATNRAKRLAGRFDQDLANRLGLSGSKQQFIDARLLIDEGWSVTDALSAASKWWGCPVDEFNALQWVVSAANVDLIRGIQ